MTNTEDTRYTGIVVAHTHWDREWYLPFQRYRMQLVAAIDRLLEILDRDEEYRYFTLDGQTVLLEDYLAVRPENAERVRCRIAEGRVLVGPWYVLADEFLPSAESLVRNLLVGQRVARSFGRCMDVGYLPDTFGHIAQMPQLLRGFGIDTAVIWRGVTSETSEFIWQAPDGSHVLAIYLPRGYCAAAGLVTAPDRFLDGPLQELVSHLKERTTGPHLLLMAGCDHLPPRPGLEEVVRRANAVLGDTRLRQGTLPEYIALVRAAGRDLGTRRGEFRRPTPGAVLPGVLSARMYLKQASAEVSMLLERGAEPLSTLGWLLGEEYPTAYLNLAWRHVLRSQPHDSICGCGADEVHQDVMARLRWAREVCQELVRMGLAAVGRRVAIEGADHDPGFVVFNPLGHGRTEDMPVTVFLQQEGAQFHIRDGLGRVVPHQEVARRSGTAYYSVLRRISETEVRRRPVVVLQSRSAVGDLVADGHWPTWRGEEVEVLVRAEDLPPVGYAVFTVHQGPGPDKFPASIDAGDTWLDNGLVRVEVHGNGTLDLLHRPTGTRYRGLNLLEHGGDAGDEYNYSPPEYDHVVIPDDECFQVRLVEAGPLRAALQMRGVLRVPARLAPDRQHRSDRLVSLPIGIRVVLHAARPRVDLEIAVDNRAQDARFRVRFPTCLGSPWVDAAGQFEVTRRPVGIDPAHVPFGQEPGDEEPVSTFPHKGFVDVSDGEKGLAVLTRGLPEYDSRRTAEGVEVAITLLRSVGWLSRPDLKTRRGNAGPQVPTPDAQCRGRHRFRYALFPHVGDWWEGRVHREAQDFMTAPSLGPLPLPEPGEQGMATLPPSASFLSVEPDHLVLSAFKRAEDGDAVVVRYYNATGEPTVARVRFGFPVGEVQRADLAERPLSGQGLTPASDGAFVHPVRPHQVCTLKVTLPKETGKEIA